MFIDLKFVKILRFWDFNNLNRRKNIYELFGFAEYLEIEFQTWMNAVHTTRWIMHTLPETNMAPKNQWL